MRRSEDLKPPYDPHEIIQDTAAHLTSERDVPPHLEQIAHSVAEAAAEMVLGEIVDLSVQFRDGNGVPMEPEHIGTVAFNGFSRNADGRWMSTFVTKNAGDLKEWPSEGIVIPLGTECVVINPIDRKE